MFNCPQDLLNDYLNHCAQPPLGWAARFDRVERAVQRVKRWFDAHWETLHHVWVYGLAFALAMYVLNPDYGWVNLAIVPVQVVFIGALIGLVELPTMLILIAVWAVLSALGAQAWRWLRRHLG
jgi:hypothetical protein